MVAQSRLSGEFVLKESNYIKLDVPIFIALSFEQIAADEFIRAIAQFLLNQKFSMLTADSRVIEIERDFPYYRFVFQTPDEIKMQIVVEYDIFKKEVSVFSVTSQNKVFQGDALNQLFQPLQDQAFQTAQQLASNTQQSQSSTTQTQTQTPTATTTTTTTTQSSSGNQAKVDPLASIAQVPQTSGNSQSSQSTQSTKTTQTTQRSQTSQSSSSAVPLTTVKKVTTQSSSKSQAPSISQTGTLSGGIRSNLETNLDGFTLFQANNNDLYPYVVEGMRNVKNVFLQQGFPTDSLVYKEAYYRIDNQALIIIFKVEVEGKPYSFEYNGKLSRVDAQRIA